MSRERDEASLADGNFIPANCLSVRMKSEWLAGLRFFKLPASRRSIYRRLSTGAGSMSA